MSDWNITLDITSTEAGPHGGRRWCIMHTMDGTEGDKPLVVIGINPSGGTHTDENGKPVFSPTARKLHRIAVQDTKETDGHGPFNRIILFNITPVATSSIKKLEAVPESTIIEVHPENLVIISRVLKAYSIPKDTPVLLCFGNAVKKIVKNKSLSHLLPEILERIGLSEQDNPYCLGTLTNEKCPWHPLFCKDTRFSKIKVVHDNGELKFVPSGTGTIYHQ